MRATVDHAVRFPGLKCRWKYSWGPLWRLEKRKLAVRGSDGWRLTDLGKRAYLAHPVTWGETTGPANCHPGLV